MSRNSSTRFRTIQVFIGKTKFKCGIAIVPFEMSYYFEIVVLKYSVRVGEWDLQSFAKLTLAMMI